MIKPALGKLFADALVPIRWKKSATVGQPSRALMKTRSGVVVVKSWN